MRGLLCTLCVCVLLSGCSLLERQYVTVEPHSGKFWESEAAGTLRAESRQDIVNDVLLLIGQHEGEGTLRLYNFSDDLSVTDTLERATVEIQQQTPLGAYAVSYITSSATAKRGYYEVKLKIGYRRTVEQLQAVVNATSTEALYSLLEEALSEDRKELAVRVGYWSADGEAQVQRAMDQVRTELELTESTPWPVSYYPPIGPVGLIEFDLDPPPPPEPPVEAEGEEGTVPAENAEGGVPAESAEEGVPAENAEGGVPDGAQNSG